MTWLLVVLALAPVGKTGASFDAETHSLEARGVAAADPRAPSADIARVKAERQARADARERLQKALSTLGHHDDPALLVDKATVKSLDYGADGSVSLVLTVSTTGLSLEAPKAKKTH